MMLKSDNTLAEALTRNAAIAAGRQGSAEEAQKLVREKIEAAGVTTEHLKQADVCGLSLENRVTARMLVQALAKLLEHPRHEELLQGLPVAGKTGTLKERFTEPDAVDAGKNRHPVHGGCIGGVHHPPRRYAPYICADFERYRQHRWAAAGEEGGRCCRCGH